MKTAEDRFRTQYLFEENRAVAVTFEKDQTQEMIMSVDESKAVWDPMNGWVNEWMTGIPTFSYRVRTIYLCGY